MFPPTQGLRLDIEAISGICGSVSIACWVVVFSPQIIENFRRGSADGLSILFLIIWLAGDVFNILGAILQGVLPTMIILAVYYTIADIVLLCQCFYYKGFTLDDTPATPVDERMRVNGNGTSERSPLLPTNGNASFDVNRVPRISDIERRVSTSSSFRERLFATNGMHLSPAIPFVPDTKPKHVFPKQTVPAQSLLKSALFNLTAVIMVCAAGVLGWWLSNRGPHAGYDSKEPKGGEAIHFNTTGQIFGYICAALYLGSRVPQLLLNYRRKSTEGISMLFFLFACIGNVTYVMSILAYSPVCKYPGHCEQGEARSIYGRYIAVNMSWLVGSFGTLLLDAGVFVQYFWYRKEDEFDECAVEDPPHLVI
ncbi:PQ-loop-domain-containing protein [Patellaria atrata CBS 101060]|uniref:PQ-loop-domain-containing protein n=1 Tax=Patellaria atrata CBS 101060 TaxID=1346257 RepID=A0A9P4SEI0_9PEZI|nr:PQ-loop-domain-containing protein [Patellaria atrata CBS 101060]